MGCRSKTKLWPLLIALAAIPVMVYAFDAIDNSGPPSEHTGGFGEPTCTECHLGTALNGGPGSVSIVVRDDGGVNVVSAYATGQTYQVTVRVSDPNQRKWGFEMSTRTQNGQQAGNLVSTNSFTQCVQPSAPKANPCQATFNGIQYISHSGVGTRPGISGGADFVFNWIAPDTSAGPVVLHAAGNAANNNSANTGDRIYATSLTLPPQAPPPPPPRPAIFSGGVVNNASFAKDPAPLAPGSIVAIFGTDLNNGSQIASSTFGEDGKLLTALGGASVKFNGIDAPIFYSFPDQLGVQVPVQFAGESSASVEVTAHGQTSESRTVFLDSVAPGIFTLNQQGTGQGVVLIANTDILVAPTDSIPGRTSRPAQRGEFITIFCTGLGAVDPPLDTGAPAGVRQTITPVTVIIDGIQLPAVDVPYSGTAPGFVGLYQINAKVPDGARTAEDVSLLVRSGGKQSNEVTIAVGP